MSVELHFLGTGDAFGSGGRFHTCFHVSAGDARLLIDCGASSLVAMKRFAVDPLQLTHVLITHFHGDHCGGLPFLLLEQRLVSRRKAPLTIVGPPGMQAHLTASLESAFPGSAATGWPFPLTVMEYAAGQPVSIDGLTVWPFAVLHSPGSNPHGLRVEIAGKTIAYSGDTQWTDQLIPLAAGADLFICEAYTCEKPVPFHLDYQTLTAHRPELQCGKLLLTHMSSNMLNRLHTIQDHCLHDGARIAL